jgi:serine/threonine protein phosphatase 1
MGDIHGCYDKMKACLDAVNFNKDTDQLIQLGDVVDRGPDTFLCIEELLGIKNLIAIKGNHDEWWREYLISGEHPCDFMQGGMETLESYTKEGINTSVHYKFFAKQIPYYLDDDMKMFCHGGFNRHKFIEAQDQDYVFWWDRDLLDLARHYYDVKTVKDYKFIIKGSVKGSLNRIFVGHTPVQYYGHSTPQRYGVIWDLDIGAGKFADGKVCIMNIDTEEYIMK